MASGDTKTEAMLNVLGNGGSGDEFRGCCNTKTQQYILDAIDRINNIQPGGSYEAGTGIEIADNTISVDTDTIQPKLTAGTNITIDADNVISASGGGGEAKVLTVDDYNYDKGNTGTNNCVAMWLLSPGLYSNSNGVNIIIASNYSFNTNNRTYLVSKSDSTNNDNVQILCFRGSSLADRTIYTMNSLGTGVISRNFLTNGDTVNGLSSSDTVLPLSANQGKVLNEKIDSLAIQNAGAPTTATVGTVGQLLEDTTNGDLYICTDATNPYVWEQVGAGGGGSASGVTELTSADYDWPENNPDGIAIWKLKAGLYYQTTGTKIYITTTVASPWAGMYIYVACDDIYANVFYGNSSNGWLKAVYTISTGDRINQTTFLNSTDHLVQTTGTSSSSVMSQNATTSMVFADPNTKNKVQIANGATAGATNSISIGYNSTCNLGSNNSVALGANSMVTNAGEVNIGSPLAVTSGYNSSAYRLLTGLYDPQNAHDAATKGYVDGLVGNVASALNAINNGTGA